MIRNIFLVTFLIANLVNLNLFAKTRSIDQPSEYRLVNQVCVPEADHPILMSDVLKRAKEGNIKPKSAQAELSGEASLWDYAKHQLKFSIPDIYKAAADHIKKIIENNKLTKEQFVQILLNPPYSMTYQQYENETAFLILKSQIESSLAAGIEITDKEIQEEYARQHENALRDFAVVFISVLPTKKSITPKDMLTSQFEKANTIRKEILDNNNLDIVKRRYKGQTDVSFIGPLDYQEGKFKDKYDAQLKKNPNAKITEPFEESGTEPSMDIKAVTMILKIPKAVSPDNHKTALENVQKDLYRRAVQRRLEAIMNPLEQKSPRKNNCKW